MRWGVRTTLVVIVLVAAALRFWGVDLGLPNPNTRPDEREMLAFTGGFRAGDFNPRWFVYPNFFFYISWAWIEVGLALQRLRVETPGYVALLHTDLAPLLFWGRTLSATAGTLTVPLVYWIGRRLRGPACGLAAAALLAGCWLHVRDSHFLKTEALLALAVLIAIDRVAVWAQRERRRDAVIAGIAIGLAMGVKYPAVFLVVPAWCADRQRAGRRGRRWLPSGDLVVLALVGALTFFAVCPFLLLDMARSSDTIELLKLALYATRPEAGAPADAGGLAALVKWITTRTFAYHLTVSLRFGIGLVATLALPIAIGRALVRPDVLPKMAAVFCILFYLVAGASPVHLARYITPLTPLMALLLADLIVAVAARTGSPRGRAMAAIALTALLVAEPLHASIAADRIAARTDTRVLATDWLRANLPKGTGVGILGTVLLPQGEPELPLKLRAVRWQEATPQAVAASDATYLLTHDHWLPFSHVDPAVIAALAPQLELVADWSPTTGPADPVFEREDAYYIPYARFTNVERPGPHVRLYRIVRR